MKPCFGGKLCSALFEGSTTHTRRKPVKNQFTYNVYMGYIDLEEAQDGRLDNWPFFSTTTPWAFLSLLASDHMMNEAVNETLLNRVRNVVKRETGNTPVGPIRLLTNLRVMGIEFNPVSFYYVFEEDGKELACVVAEVGNFPWFEQHNYVIRPTSPPDTLRRFNSHDKAFHVSPFMGMAMQYDWLISVPQDELKVRIGLQEESSGFFMASLDAKRAEWSVWNMLRMQLMYPIHSMRVMGGILYEAGKLFRRGLAFFPHPAGAETKLSKAVEMVVGVGLGIKGKLTAMLGRQIAV